ncbi:MAG: flavodoxin family protein [Spirochaetales bacterium]|nr:flavodoxin family protein [Spirochaetales bacterium]
MNILFVNAAQPSQAEAEVLYEWLGASFPDSPRLLRADVRKKNILPCTACMSCQMKTPGICVRQDDMRELLPVYIQSDIVVYLTPLFCGGYCSELKKFIDRLCPVLTACFEKRNDETWHIPRYEKRPAVIGIGLADGSRSSEKIFNTLFSRNMKQLHILEHSCLLLPRGKSHEELRAVFRHSFQEAGIAL